MAIGKQMRKQVMFKHLKNDMSLCNKIFTQHFLKKLYIYC